MNCAFCHLSDADQKWLLFDNDLWSVYLADKQDYIGRCIVVAKNHRESLSELDDIEWLSLKTVVKMLEDLLRNELGATMFNWSCLMNDAYKAAHPLPHIHFHVRPRYASPVCIGSYYFCDGEFAHHYDSHREDHLDRETRELLFAKLSQAVHKDFN